PLDLFRDRRTPFYFYDAPLLKETLEAVLRQLADRPTWRVHYAVKANFNPALLRIIAESGFGADCVSGGEVQAALDAGFPAETIVFAGVGKRDDEIALALAARIGRFNVESTAELVVINEIAASMGCTAPVSFRINPDVGAHTHANITTGLAENKFGIHHSQLDEAVQLALRLPNIDFRGLHFHIGSQILEMSDFVALCNRINACVSRLELLGVKVGDINVGGGLGVEYEHPNHLPIADFKAYFDVFKRHLDASRPVHFELGRSIIAPCGTLISRVLYVKEGLYRKFAILDASMTELIRPALYHAYHRIENLTSDGPEEKYDVVGPVCESTDVFGKGVELSQCHRGDYIAIRSAGAYGESMASQYNCHPLPESFIWKG
ncbi:MAG: diaminopimelate decarboxylase, partial [Bacteroidales bacterium]|nr:diaminopimelate decarboxylase [Bacteroidales bacterium]